MLVDVENVAEVQHEVPAAGDVAGPEVERGLVIAQSRAEGIQGTRSVAGLTQGEPGRGLERHGLLSRRPSELQGAEVVVGEHLGMVLGSAERIDPFRGQTVLLGPRGAWDLAIRNVADKEVAEGVLQLPCNGRTALPAHELLPLEGVQAALRRLALDVAHRADRSEPEELAEHGSRLKQGLLLARQSVETRGDDPLHRLGHGDLLRAPLDEHAGELLGVEGVAARSRQQVGLLVSGKDGALEQSSDEASGLLVGQRRQ